MKYFLSIFCCCIFLFACDKDKQTSSTPIPIKGSDTTETGYSDSIDITYNTSPLLESYTSNNTPQFQTFIIKKGNNFCEGNNYIIGEYGDLKFSAILDSSCIYTTSNPSNQADINKLFGYSDCTSHHHKNSARFGWNWYQGALRIHAYCYVDSVRTYREIGTVKVNEEFECKLTLQANAYIFSLNGDTVKMERGCTDAKAIGYLLYPYFGGDEPSPQDMSIKIKLY